MSATTMTVGGSSVTFSQHNVWPVKLTYRYKGLSTFEFEERGGPLNGLPDPYLGKPVVLQLSSTNIFVGDVVHFQPIYTHIGWVKRYLCRDLKERGNQIPLTDDNTLTDVAAYNLQPDDINFFPSRAGRDIGQIITDVLTMVDNATALDAAGIGAYTSLSPPTLPSSTVADLALLTTIPPSECRIQGEKLINSIEAFIRYWAPNHVFWIQWTDGAIRILDQRTFTSNTLTMGQDPIEPTPLRRSVAECFQRVIVRGAPIAEPKLVDTLSGTLTEDFGYTAPDGTTVTSAAAKAAWTPDQTVQDQTARSEGSCTCIDTLNVTITPNTSQVWPADFWDFTSTGHQGNITFIYPAGTNINQTVWRRIVSNTALTIGGSCDVQVDYALPATNYTAYKIYGHSNGQSLVYKKYKVANTNIAAALANQFTFPAVWVGYGNNVAALTSFPMGSTCWSASGDPPYNENPAWFTIDPSSGNIYFQQATYITAGNKVPTDVRALLAVNTGANTAIYPPNSGGSPVYGGTSYTVEGLDNTLTVTVGQWRDPINHTAMLAFAEDLWSSVSDAIVEGSVIYHGLWSTALTAGQALSIDGYAAPSTTYPTGYEGLDIAIQETELHWNSGTMTQYTTIMHLSNRRAHFTSEQFLRPSRSTQGVGFGGESMRGRAAITEEGESLEGMHAAGEGLFNEPTFDRDELGVSFEEDDRKRKPRKQSQQIQRKEAQRQRQQERIADQQARGLENLAEQQERLEGGAVPQMVDESKEAQRARGEGTVLDKEAQQGRALVARGTTEDQRQRGQLAQAEDQKLRHQINEARNDAMKQEKEKSEKELQAGRERSSPDVGGAGG